MTLLQYNFIPTLPADANSVEMRVGCCGCGQTQIWHSRFVMEWYHRWLVKHRKCARCAMGPRAYWAYCAGPGTLEN